MPEFGMLRSKQLHAVRCLSKGFLPLVAFSTRIFSDGTDFLWKQTVSFEFIALQLTLVFASNKWSVALPLL
jgi:hypothetical protein